MAENKDVTQGPEIKIDVSHDERYATFDLISWWRQEVVRNATIMVIGAGALGNEVLKNLALMGVGRIFVVDFDVVEYSNLSRSVLFRASDEGRKKVEVAAEAVRDLNPDVKVQGYHADANHDLGLGVYRRMDVVIGCLDNRVARLSVNRACWHLDKPWVDGAIQELLGVARVFWPNRGACYECTMNDEDYQSMQERYSCSLLARQSVIAGRVPTTPTVSSIVGGIEAQEAMKILHGLSVDCGQAVVVNGLSNDFFIMEYQEKEDCFSHILYDDITELSDASVFNITAKELIDFAHGTFSEEAILLIPPFVTKATCTRCLHEHNLAKPQHRLDSRDLHCEQCGGLMSFNLTEEITGVESFSRLTLHELGVPPLDIVATKTKDWRFRFFELTGDEERVFEFS